MYQGPVRVSHFEKCDAEEVSYANYGHDSQGNIVCINTSCLWMGPGKDFLSKKGIQGKCCTSQKESQSLWSVCVPAMAAECAEGPRRGNSVLFLLGEEAIDVPLGWDGPEEDSSQKEGKLEEGAL